MTVPRAAQRAERLRLERIHLLRTLVNYGPLTGVELADRANTECDHDLLEGLPEISRYGIAAKLNSMSLDGLVTGRATGNG